MATVQLPGKSTLDMASRKIEGLAAATKNGDAVRYDEFITLHPGIPQVTVLPTTIGDLGDIIQLTQDDGTFIPGAYVRIANNSVKLDFVKVGERIAGDTLPADELYDGRIFYLEAGAGSAVGWHIYRVARAASITPGPGDPGYVTAITAGWYLSGETIEATRIYPTLGASIAATEHVEPFQITAGLWTFGGEVYLYTGFEHDINDAQGAFQNAPLIPGQTDLTTGWELWDTFVNSSANQIAAITYPRNADEKTEDEWIAGDGFTVAADGDYVIGDTFFYEDDAGDRANYVVTADFTAAIDPDPATADAYILGLIGTEIAVTAAGNFVPVAANALNFVGLGANNHFLTNTNHQMEFATEQNHNYHIDLLYFSTENGRMILNTDSLQAVLDGKEDDFPSLGLGSMIVDASLDTTTPPNWVAFKPLMTGLDATGVEEEQNFAVETASDDHQHWPTTKEWQEANLLGIDSELIEGTGIEIDEVVTGNVKSYTIRATDNVLNRADVTIDNDTDQVLRTGEEESIITFLAEAVDEAAIIDFGHSADNTPPNGSISFIDGTEAVTSVWTSLADLRVLEADTTSSNLFQTFAADDVILLTWGAVDAPDTDNWALLHVTGDAVLDATTDYRDLPVEVIDGEYGGAILADDVLVSYLAGDFNPEAVLRFVAGTAANPTLTHSGIFELVKTGITTISTVDADGNPIAAGNTNTTIGTVGTGNATATLHHAPVNAMAYLAIQFHASIPKDITATITGTPLADTIYLEYESVWDGTTDTTFVDQINTTSGATVTYRNFDLTTASGDEVDQL